MEEDDRVNFISELPDEILVKIICLLPLKEAARTGILSKRWIDLWRYVANLDIDFEAIRKRDTKSLRLKTKRSWYVNWMNNICSLHRSSTIHKFRVCLDLEDKGYRDHIDGWLDFALSRRVKKLEFDLNHTGACYRGLGSYVLSKDTFDRIIARRGLSSIRFLTSLSLKYVDVASEVLERFLSCCPLLERLTVDMSPGLVKFRVVGFRLKELSIASCFSLQELEIDAANLVSLAFRGQKITLHMQNVPRLVKVCFGFWSHLNTIFATGKPQNGYFSQLRTLELITTQNQLSFSNLPQFSCLQNLILVVNAKSDASLLALSSIINVSPSLKKLMLSLYWCWSTSCECNKIELPHQSLKEVEIVGYEGNSSDREFAEYILRHAAVLERIILDAREPLNLQTRYDPKNKKTQRARENAWELKSFAPPSLEFIVL